MITKYNKFLNPKTLSFLVFFISTYYIYFLNNIYYLSTNSPDFDKYSKYLDYFFNGSIIETSNVQSPLYYWLVSYYFSNKTNLLSPDNYQIVLSSSIQIINLFLYLIGLLGLYKLLKLKNYKSENILIMFAILNFFPISIASKITFKNEIMTFAFLPIILFYFESFKLTSNKKFLIYAIPLLSIVLTSKASTLGIVSLFLLIGYYDLLNKLVLNNKKILVIFLISVFVLFYENLSINNKNLFQESHPSRYENVLQPKDLFSNPFSEDSSVTKVILSEIFGDYFDLYWDYDSSLYNSNRKEFIKYNNKFKFNLINKEVYFNNEIFKNPNFLDKSREVYSLILSFVVLYLLIKNRNIFEDKFFIYSPLIGVLVLIINSLGFPSKNFDPEVMDTFKTYYYFYLFLISFSFFILNIFKTRFGIYFVLIFFSISSLFIIGLPKKNESYFNEIILYRIQNTEFCSLNTKIVLYDEPSIYAKNCIEENVLFCLSDSFYRFNDDKLKEFVSIDMYKDANKTTVSSFNECINATNKGYKLISNEVKPGKLPAFNFIFFIAGLILFFETLKPKKTHED